jgi:hypothetical protein
MKLFRSIRLSTLLLSMVVVALVFGLYVQKRREAQLQAALSFYRDPMTEAIYDALDHPLGLTYPDEAPLEDVLKEIRQRTTGSPKLKTGIAIYVDPIGMQEAEKSMLSTINRPPSADTLTLGEHLTHILHRLQLAYVVRDGFLMVTSKGSLDVETGDAVNPYLHYRDVLR